jgi:hypothetical protein
VAFQRKQESRKKHLDSHFRGNDIQGGKTRLSPGRERPANRQVGQVRGPTKCMSTSTFPPSPQPSPARGEGTILPLPRRAEEPHVSFLRKQQSRLPCACPPWHSSVSRNPFPCHSCASRNPGKNILDSHFRGNDTSGRPRSFLRKQQSRLPCASPPWHSCVSRNPAGVIPAQAGTQEKIYWIPAFAGMTYKGVFLHRRPGSQQAFYRPNRRHRSRGRLYRPNRRRKSHKPKAPRASPASRPLAGSGTPSCNCKICSLGPP